MANPQKQNGYVPIANELLEAIYKTDMTRNELRVLLCVLRYTYGYNTKSERLSLGFISSETGLAKSRASEALNGLKGKNITIVGEWQSKEPREIAIQKDYEKWFRVTENVTVTKNVTVTESVTQGVTESVTPTSNKDNYIKDNIYSSVTENVTQDELPEWFEQVWKEYPNKKGKDRISKKSYKALSEAGKDNLLKAIHNYKAYCEQNKWYKPQHGSTFFNGGWKDYLDSEPAEPENEYAGMDFEEIFAIMREKGEVS